MMHIVFIDAVEWQGIYINGKLAAQAHSLSAEDILSALGITYIERKVDEEWLCNSPIALPDDISEVKFSR